MGVGSRIRQTREARGISVREIADRTKIPARLIDAIETEHYEKLPGGIFGRGYVRAVATALKLDGDAIVSGFRQETEGWGSSEPSPSHSHTAAPSIRPHMSAPVTEPLSRAWRADHSEPRLRFAADPLPRTTGRHRLVAAVLLGLCAVLLILWWGQQSSPQAQGQKRPAPVPQQQARGATAPSPVGTVGEGATSLSRPAGLLVTLRADRPCWVVFTVDGQRVVYRLLQPGDTARAVLHERATLHTGNAGGLRVAVGGDEMRPIGAPGEVRTIEFTPANYRVMLTR